MVKFFLDPFNILLFLGSGTVLFFLTGKKSAGKKAAILTLICFLISSTPFVPTALLSSLENRYQPVNPELMTDKQRDSPYHIVVLGGGHGYDDRLPPNSLLSLQALARLNEGIRLHRQLRNSKLVLSGYSASGRIPQAIMLKNTAIILGSDESRIVTLEEPGNTFEEAKTYANEFGYRYPVILVTSARHMPRAVRVFNDHGVEVTASPTEFEIKQSTGTKWFGTPSAENMLKFKKAIYEYAAITREIYLR